jgi:hypothetical protein
MKARSAIDWREKAEVRIQKSENRSQNSVEKAVAIAFKIMILDSPKTCGVWKKIKLGQSVYG